MPPNRRNSATAGRSSARNSPWPLFSRSYTAGSSQGRTCSSLRTSARIGAHGADETGLTMSLTTPQRWPFPSNPPLAYAPKTGNRGDGRRIEHDLALPCLMLGGGQLIEDRAGQRVDDLEARGADQKAPRGAGRHRHFHRERQGPARGERHAGEPLHRLL